MRQDDLARLTIASTLAELPGVEEVHDIGVRAGVVGQLFERRPEIPGVLVAAAGQVVSAVSRRYYLDTIGRYLGHDVYTPRPLGVLLRRFQDLGGALMLPAATPIPEAVRAGLQRPRELVYEPVVVAAEPSRLARLVDFEDLLLADSRVTQLRNLQMRQILSTVHEGLLLVGPDHRIANEHSDSVQAIFDTVHVAGRRLEELLGEGLDEERCTLAADYLDTLFDPRIIESLVVKVNPLMRVVMTTAERQKVLEFRFARSGEGRRIDHVLVRVEDVSRREELSRELESQRERADLRLALAMGLSHADPAEAGPFLAALEDELRQLVEAAGPAGQEPAAKAARARGVHRLKGEAGLLGLRPFELALHRLEDGLGRAARDDGGETLAAALLEVDALRRDAADLIDRFGRLAADRASGAPYRPRVEALPATAPAAVSPTGSTPESGWTALCAELELLARRMAIDLGKRVRVRASAGNGGPPVEWRELLRGVLVQLLRNAVAHGIEAPEERRRVGKPPEGLVQVALRQHAELGWLELIVQDDGRGLDREAVRRRAERLGLAVPAADGWTELLFHSGFSTEERPHLHAGRGVGLDAVRDLVAARGGRVELHSQPGRFCAAQVLLPLAMAVPA